MSLGVAMSPNGGVNSRRVMEERPLNPVSVYQWHALQTVIHFRLRPDDFREPPRADPHAGWCGEGRLNAVPYPISAPICDCFFFAQPASFTFCIPSV